MMKKIILYILAYILLLSTTYALVDEEIFYVDNIEVDLDISSEIDIIYQYSSSTMSYIEALLSFYPKNTWRQEVSSLETVPYVEPVGDIIRLRWTAPNDESVSFSVDSKVKSFNKFRKVKTKIPFPIKNLDSEYQQYTEPTKFIDLNNDMVVLATDIAEGEDDLYTVVSKIAGWVNKNIEYSLSTFTAQASKESSWVLANREGVCDELTNLFISMCRSVGIPARFVSGYSYTNSPLFDNEWGPHGWAEVYFPNYGWVPFDVTFAQFGYIDAGHIKFGDGFDSSGNSVSYEWRGRDASIDTKALNIEVRITKKGNLLSDILDLEAKPLAGEIGFGSYNLIEATLENDNDFYISSDVILLAPVEVQIIGDNKQLVTMKPKETGKAYWIIKIPSNLEKESIYTFPMLIVGLRNQTFSFDFRSSFNEVNLERKDVEDILEQKQKEETKTYSKSLELSCTSKDEISLDETLRVNCNLMNLGNINLKDLDVCLEEDCKSFDLLLMQENNVEFEKTFSEEGEKIITVTAENEKISKSSSLIVVVTDKPSVNMNNLVKPENVNYGDEFLISFELQKGTLANPKNLKIMIYLNDIKREWLVGELTKPTVYEFKFDGSDLKLDENDIKVLITFEDDKSEEYKAEENFTINLNEPALSEKIIIFFKQLTVKIFNFFSNLFS